VVFFSDRLKNHVSINAGVGGSLDFSLTAPATPTSAQNLTGEKKGAEQEKMVTDKLVVFQRGGRKEEIHGPGQLK